MSKVENTICSICLTSPLHPIQPSDQPTTTHWFGLCSLQDSQTATAQTQRKNVVVIMSFRTKLCHLQSCTCAALFRLYELALWYPRPMSAEMCLIPTRMKHQKVCNITHLGTRLQDATRCYKYILHWYSLIFIDLHWQLVGSSECWTAGKGPLHQWRATTRRWCCAHSAPSAWSSSWFEAGSCNRFCI
jgi:hypothetical protein